MGGGTRRALDKLKRYLKEDETGGGSDQDGSGDGSDDGSDVVSLVSLVIPRALTPVCLPVLISIT